MFHSKVGKSAPDLLKTNPFGFLSQSIYQSMCYKNICYFQHIGCRVQRTGPEFRLVLCVPLNHSEIQEEELEGPEAAELFLCSLMQTENDEML